MQCALRRDARVELSQGSGSSVARIGEDLPADRFLSLVKGAEICLSHEDLAANLDYGRGIGGQGLRDVLDGLQIAGDVFTFCAVAPRCSQNECAIFIPQRCRQAVDLWLGDECDGHVVAKAEKAPDAGDEIRHVLI